jgi:acetolactate synthase-1/2/3 large subunit
MKRRISDIIADYLADRNITDVFCLVGGGAMFLNDAFGHNERITVTYNQHEQACSMAAEGYVRASGKPAVVCVTTGPGGTNAITGVLGAFQDNYPMLVISGQVRYPTCADSTGLSLRFMGEQEHNIVDTVKPLTKYAVMVKKPEDVLYEIEKALYLAEEGRKAPCWVDIPMDIQSREFETDDLRHFEIPKTKSEWDMSAFISEIKRAKRPVILTGSAIRSTGYVEKFRQLAAKLNIPVLAATYNADLFTNDDPAYYGNFGIIGGRVGNFIMQNADLVIAMGCRMTFRQIGFNYEQFSPNSKRIVFDVDENELKKPTLRIDMPICADIKTVIDDLIAADNFRFEDSQGWLDYCKMLRVKFPMYLDKFSEGKAGQVNPYYFVKQLKSHMKPDSVIVLGNSTIAAHILQLGIELPEQRIINNMNCGSMGYDLPAAIGAAVAVKKSVTLITGDGSIMLNIQELMTVKHYKLPIKIFISCNGGYRGIVRSQSNMFAGRYTGCTEDTGVEMPDFSKVAVAFDIPFVKISGYADLDAKLSEIYAMDGPVVVEWPQDPEQVIEPRVMNRKTEDGSIVSSDIDDMAPFLDRDVYEGMKFENWKKIIG